MPGLVRRSERSLPMAARHVVFAGEDSLAFTTPTADVWKVPIDLAPSQAELLLPGRSVLSPVARALGREAVDPAGGGYPRLAVSSRADAVVVNTHDFVLVACPSTGDGCPRLISHIWGEYYPRLEFSPDGSRFAAKADTLLVFETRDWTGGAIDGVAVCAWHPRRPAQLCVGHDGELFWADWCRGGAPAIYRLSCVGLRGGWDEARGLVVLEDGERFVVAFYPPRLELWRLDPPRLIDHQTPSDGEVLDLRPISNGKWLVVRSERGVRLWRTADRFELSDLFPGIRDPEPAPSGQWLVARRPPTWASPQPTGRVLAGGGSADLVDVWEVAD